MRLFSNRFSSSFLVLFAAGCAGAPARAPLGPLVASSSLRAGALPSAASSRVQRHIIHAAHLQLEHKHVEHVAQQAASTVRALGGNVADSRHAGDRVTLRLRVPSAQLFACLAQLKRLGEATSLQVRGEDVTTQVVDLELRLDTALKARKRYLELLARANSVSEALPVQKELEKVIATVEALKAQIARVRALVRLATIEVTIERPVRPGVLGWLFYGVYRGVKWLFVWD